MMNLEAIRPMNASVSVIPDGDAGTAATIAAMWRLIGQGKKSAFVREVAVGIVREARVRAHDRQGEMRALFQWALRNIRFTSDIRGCETLHSADEILRLQSGDCDDFTVLLLSLAEALGAEGRIVTISSLPPDDSGAPPEFTHVYPEVFAAGRWIALDAARSHPAFGKQPRWATRAQCWEDPAEDAAGVEYLNFYPGRTVTAGFRQRSMSRSLSGRARSLRAWDAQPYMTSVPRVATYNPNPPKKMSGLGRMGQDWTALLPTLISGGAAATTEIIAASKGASVAAPGVQTGVAPGPYTYPFSATPSGGAITPGYNAPGVTATGSVFGMSPTTLIMVALGFGALMFLGRR